VTPALSQEGKEGNTGHKEALKRPRSSLLWSSLQSAGAAGAAGAVGAPAAARPLRQARQHCGRGSRRSRPARACAGTVAAAAMGHRGRYGVEVSGQLRLQAGELRLLNAGSPTALLISQFGGWSCHRGPHACRQRRLHNTAPPEVTQPEEPEELPWARWRRRLCSGTALLRVGVGGCAAVCYSRGAQSGE
jgi:hypothetical protein